jgi:tRNA dimethylallyltransferase
VGLDLSTIVMRYKISKQVRYHCSKALHPITTKATTKRMRLIIVAGPTASGKSALALALAERLGGVVINADAMQCYAELRIITARPSPADEARAPHRLYGIQPITQPMDAAKWRLLALGELAAARQAGLMPILCGGTGMYLRALLRGLADIPDPGTAARDEARALLTELGPAGLHARLTAVDLTTASRLRPGDSQRLARAYEVWRGTGHGLAWWQAIQPEPLTGWAARVILLAPPREALREAIAVRFRAMLDHGALDEVRPLMDLDPALPGLRAHGVPELLAHLRGEASVDEAASRATAASFAYVKRQDTWFRHQKLADERHTHMIHARIADATQFLQRNDGRIMRFINGPG